MSTPHHPLISVIEDREWVDDAICRNQGTLFFEPFRERPLDRRTRELEAKRLCARCPVRHPCRDAGRRNHESGIWGGETEEERALAGFPLRSVGRSSAATARRAAISAQLATEMGVTRSPHGDEAA